MTAPALKLYEATDAIEIVREWLEEHDQEIRDAEGVLNPELAELLAKVEGDFDAKAERVGLFVRELEATCAAIAIEEKRLGARRKSVEKRIEGMKFYLLGNMIAAEKPRVEGNLLTLRIQKNPPAVKQEREIDQSELKGLHDKGVDYVVRIPPVPASYAIDSRALISASKVVTGAGKKAVTTYKCPIEGVAIEQADSLRFA